MYYHRRNIATTVLLQHFHAYYYQRNRAPPSPPEYHPPNTPQHDDEDAEEEWNSRSDPSLTHFGPADIIDIYVFWSSDLGATSRVCIQVVAGLAILREDGLGRRRE